VARPRWSDLIMDEVTRNLIAKWGMPIDQARRREDEIRRHFPEAWVEGFQPLIEAMTNDAGDRHVLAAAVRSDAELIVTYNRRHFPADSVQPWEIEEQSPSTFLRGLYDLEPGLFVRKLYEQPEAIGVSAGGRAGQPFEQRPELYRVLPRRTGHRVCRMNRGRLQRCRANGHLIAPRLFWRHRATSPLACLSPARMLSRGRRAPRTICPARVFEPNSTPGIFSVQLVSPAPPRYGRLSTLLVPALLCSTFVNYVAAKARKAGAIPAGN